MKLLVYGPERRVGLISGDQVFDINGAYKKYIAEDQGEPLPSLVAASTVPQELGAFIAAGERALQGAQRAVEYLTRRATNQVGLKGESLVAPLQAVKPLAPFASRARLFMAGSNYPVHVQGARQEASKPQGTLDKVRADMREIGIRGFISFTENAIGTDEDIIYPSRTDRLDYEGEIAVVIGKKGKDIKAADGRDYFWGYMLVNDVSARTAVPRADNPGSRFARDKNFDTSMCGGPYVVAGEIADPQDVSWETRVNGEVRQRGNTNDMAFSFAELLEHLSEDMTIFPGDVICAGTTGGTATDSSPFMPAEAGARPQKDPKLFLKVGDSVEVSNPVLGLLRNRVVAKR